MMIQKKNQEKSWVSHEEKIWIVMKKEEKRKVWPKLRFGFIKELIMDQGIDYGSRN